MFIDKTAPARLTLPKLQVRVLDRKIAVLSLLLLTEKKNHSFKTVQHVLANVATVFLIDSMNAQGTSLPVFTNEIALYEDSRMKIFNVPLQTLLLRVNAAAISTRFVH